MIVVNVFSQFPRFELELRAFIVGGVQAKCMGS
ncbi:hypothetical protein ABIB85_008487 [Bradyrhizobium sp. JR1.5]